MGQRKVSTIAKRCQERAIALGDASRFTRWTARVNKDPTWPIPHLLIPLVAKPQAFDLTKTVVVPRKVEVTLC